MSHTKSSRTEVLGELKQLRSDLSRLQESAYNAKALRQVALAIVDAQVAFFNVTASLNLKLFRLNSEIDSIRHDELMDDRRRESLYNISMTVNSVGLAWLAISLAIGGGLWVFLSIPFFGLGGWITLVARGELKEMSRLRTTRMQNAMDRINLLLADSSTSSEESENSGRPSDLGQSKRTLDAARDMT